MCVDYTNFNKACPKDNYPLSHIDQLVNSVSSYKVLFFLDAYSGYKEIPIHLNDIEKNPSSLTYCYKVMFFFTKKISR